MRPKYWQAGWADGFDMAVVSATAAAEHIQILYCAILVLLVTDVLMFAIAVDAEP